MATLKEGAKVLDRLLQSLKEGSDLSEPYTEALLREAQNRAASRPTPQAPMVGRELIRNQSTISVLPGGTPQAVSGGSEWGSDIYTQFGPRNEGGWWLMPSTESEAALSAGDRALDQMIDSAIRGFF